MSPNPNNGQKPVNGTSTSVRLSATLTDVDTVSPVVRGEAFIDTLGAPGTGIVMQAADGAFSTPTENAYLDIPLASVRQMTDGNHTLYVRGKDAAGSWGAAASTVLKVDKTGPAITGLTLTPNPTNGAGTVTLTASVTDPLSSIASAEWFLGADPGVGNGAALSIGPGGTGGPVSATVTRGHAAGGQRAGHHPGQGRAGQHVVGGGAAAGAAPAVVLDLRQHQPARRGRHGRRLRHLRTGAAARSPARST